MILQSIVQGEKTCINNDMSDIIKKSEKEYSDLERFASNAFGYFNC